MPFPVRPTVAVCAILSLPPHPAFAAILDACMRGAGEESEVTLDSHQITVEEPADDVEDSPHLPSDTVAADAIVPVVNSAVPQADTAVVTSGGDAHRDLPLIDAAEVAGEIILPQITNRSGFFEFGDKKIRKTHETPQRISVYDLIAAITDQDGTQSSHLYKRLLDMHPEVRTWCTNFKFSGRGQRLTPVTDARGAVMIMSRKFRILPPPSYLRRALRLRRLRS